MLPTAIPPRSRLCNLEPAGVGTPHVESLSGYVSRLAETHSTSLYYLFSEEVAPLIDKPGTISRRVSFKSFAKAANGLGVIAADLVKVFESLTLRQDLRLTTMLPWANVISSKSLTRELRAWCPACYDEGAAGGGKVYDQLLWSVQSVTVCVRHERRLEHECRYCSRRQVPLSHRIHPGFCGKCQAWLGDDLGSKLRMRTFCPGGITVEELTAAEEVGKMLAAAPELSPRTARAIFSANLRPHVEKMFVGRGVPSTLRLPAGKQTVRCWLRGTQAPSLTLLLKMCLALKISALDLLRSGKCGGSDCESAVVTHKEYLTGSPAEAVEHDAYTRPVNWGESESLERVERKLREALGEVPPSSLTKIAGELKCTRATLRKKFPTLAARVAARAQAYYRTPASHERMSEVLQAALKEEPPPPLADVSRRIGKGASTTTLHKKFPEESREIVERYGAARKRRLDNAALETQLRAALEMNPPPSTPELSRKIGVAGATLYSKFPDLFKTIANRFAVYRRERDARNKELAKAEIKAICECSLREGVYPSAALVRSRLSVPCQSATVSRLRREILAEHNPAGRPFSLVNAQPLERHESRG